MAYAHQGLWTPVVRSHFRTFVKFVKQVTTGRGSSCATSGFVQSPALQQQTPQMGRMFCVELSCKPARYATKCIQSNKHNHVTTTPYAQRFQFVVVEYSLQCTFCTECTVRTAQPIHPSPPYPPIQCRGLNDSGTAVEETSCATLSPSNPGKYSTLVSL